MAKPQTPDSDQRRGIQSIEVGFSLVRALAAAASRMPLKTLAAAADMTPSKAHLYLVSFIRIGLVTQDASSRYGLGPEATKLGIAAINQLDVVEIARHHFDEFVDVHGISVSLAVWSDRGPTILYRVDGKLPVPTSVRVGHVLPLLPTATGRVFMAYLPASSWQDIVEAEAKFTPELLTRSQAMLDEVRLRRMAMTDSQLHVGFFGISAPIFDHENQICAAVSAHGLSEAIDLSPRGAIAGGIARAARAISTGLGTSIFDE